MSVTILAEFRVPAIPEAKRAQYLRATLRDGLVYFTGGVLVPTSCVVADDHFRVDAAWRKYVRANYYPNAFPHRITRQQLEAARVAA